jgi:hypothetical protein
VRCSLHAAMHIHCAGVQSRYRCWPTPNSPAVASHNRPHWNHCQSQPSNSLQLYSCVDARRRASRFLSVRSRLDLSIHSRSSTASRPSGARADCALLHLALSAFRMSEFSVLPRWYFRGSEWCSSIKKKSKSSWYFFRKPPSRSAPHSRSLVLSPNQPAKQGGLCTKHTSKHAQTNDAHTHF